VLHVALNVDVARLAVGAAVLGVVALLLWLGKLASRIMLFLAAVADLLTRHHWPKL
jgi:hypothetical protein